MRAIIFRRVLLPALAAVLAVTPAWAGATAASAPGAGVPDDLRVPAGQARPTASDAYLVVMQAEPAATYAGGIPGLAPTRPALGGKLQPGRPEVRTYRDHLRDRHSTVLRAAGASDSAKLYDYTVALNGFAAELTPAQVASLRTQPGVVSVTPDVRLRPQTITTPRFLGLTGPSGTWSRGFRGQGMVVGVVDSGIWPENGSFSDRRAGRLVYGEPRLWYGACETGDRFTTDDCNNKLIGARFFGEGFGGETGIRTQFPYEYWSPRDANGHGSHTAGTAGGNAWVPAVIDGQRYGLASGMAPRARLAAYKVCWGRGEEGGCFSSDSVAAIDRAVADGVDVINFSISGSSTSFVDPVELAFLNAASAGVFVAASGGNSGPGASTVNHPSPWITTVAASTHDRLSEARLTLGDGRSYVGASAQRTGTDPLPLVYAGDIPAAGADPGDAALCFPDSLDPTAAAGKMVICDRGVNARTEKSHTVREAGGAAMVLVNTSPNSVNADIHFVPSVHLDSPVRAELLAYARTTGATGQLSASRLRRDPTAPVTAVFSSRGPSAAGGDVIKPDITAPGVDVLAAVSPPGNFGRRFDLLSGTSMSSPHIAGLAAVVRSARPGWSPARVKSALMTTAYDVAGATPFDVGSGHVDVNRALLPVLTYDASQTDYLNFICGTGQVPDSPLCRNAIDPSDLNQPNIAIGELAGRQTVTRTVTNVGRAATFRARVQPPAGVDVSVRPSTLQLSRGERGTFRVTFTARSEASFDEFAFGELHWVRGDGRRVGSDIAVRPVAIAAPDEVAQAGTSGADEFEVRFGYTGAYTAAAHGLELGRKSPDTVVDDPANDINVALETGVGITIHEIAVPAGTVLSRFSLFDDYTDGNDDLDLYVFDPDGNFAGASGTGTSAERVDVSSPAAGTWFVVVHGWQTDGPDAAYTLFDWSVAADPAADDGSLVIDQAPAAATVGATGTVAYSWSGLTAGEKYLGALSHNGPTGLLATTLVAVDTD